MLCPAKRAHSNAAFSLGPEAKALIQQARSILEQGLGLEREYFVELFDSADQAEGVRAFLDKRPARWRNA